MGDVGDTEIEGRFCHALSMFFGPACKAKGSASISKKNLKQALNLSAEKISEMNMRAEEFEPVSVQEFQSRAKLVFSNVMRLASMFSGFTPAQLEQQYRSLDLFMRCWLCDVPCMRLVLMRV